MRRKTSIAYALGAAVLLAGAYELVFFRNGVEPGASGRLVSNIILVILIVLWVDADSQDQPAIYRPFEYEYLVWLFWIPYLPYYFWRTRGARGLLLCGGLIALAFSNYLFAWLMRLAR